MVYDITCDSCGEQYIGQTGRTLDKRLNESWEQTTSAVCGHQAETRHSIDWEGDKVIERESVESWRKIKVTSHNGRWRPFLNKTKIT